MDAARTEVEAKPEAAWHIADAGRPDGPYPHSRVIEMIRAGQVSAGTMVWSKGMPDWRPAHMVDSLRRHLPVAQIAAAASSAPALGDDAGIRLLLPVGRSPWAIVCGYLGLISLFPVLGVVAGPAAIITGILAIVDIRRNGRYGMVRTIVGMTLGVISTALHVLVLIAVMLDG